MSIKNNQHYLSKFYLKYFSNICWSDIKGKPNQWKVFCYDIKTSTTKEDYLSNVAFKSNLFSFINENWEIDNSLETNFCKEENWFSNLLRKINKNILSYEQKNKWEFIKFEEKEKKIIIDFIKFQYKRSIAVNADNLKRRDEVWKEAKNLFTSEATKETEEGYKQNFNKILLDILFHEENILDLLYNKSIYFYYIKNASNKRFITSDFPIYRYSPIWDEWILYQDNEISFPITEKIIMKIAWDGWIFHYLEIEDNLIDDFNKKTIANATNLIIWSSETQIENAKKIKENNPYSKNTMF